MLRLAMTLVLWLCPLAAMAAPGGTEVWGGYTTLRIPRDAVTLRQGWVAGTLIPVSRVLGVTAEVGGNRRVLRASGSDVTLGVLDVMAGPRLSARVGRATEFVHVLVGAAQGRGAAFGETEAHTNFAVQPGIGLDYPLTTRLHARAAFDARLLRDGEVGQSAGSQFRWTLGLVYRVP
ncbi:MAG: hypothetical protein U0Q11_18895 [Vicinamibacterales bacterium]